MSEEDNDNKSFIDLSKPSSIAKPVFEVDAALVESIKEHKSEAQALPDLFEEEEAAKPSAAPTVVAVEIKDASSLVPTRSKYEEPDPDYIEPEKEWKPVPIKRPMLENKSSIEMVTREYERTRPQTRFRRWLDSWGLF